MALYITDGPIPAGTVQLTRHEAINHQWHRIREWPKQSQVWPFHWGIGAMGLLSAATGIYINNCYRRKLKIRRHGFLSALMPMFFSPAILSTIVHFNGVTSEIFLHTTKCPVCLHTKAVVSQVASGVVYSLVIGPIINCMIAFQFATYRVPYWKDVRGHVDLWLKMTRPLGKTLLPIAFAHVLVAGVVTYAEVESLYTIDTETTRKENETEETLSLDDKM